MAGRARLTPFTCRRRWEARSRVTRSRTALSLRRYRRARIGCALQTIRALRSRLAAAQQIPKSASRSSMLSETTSLTRSHRSQNTFASMQRATSLAIQPSPRASQRSRSPYRRPSQTPCRLTLRHPLRRLHRVPYRLAMQRWLRLAVACRAAQPTALVTRVSIMKIRGASLRAYATTMESISRRCTVATAAAAIAMQRRRHLRQRHSQHPLRRLRRRPRLSV